MFILYSRRVIYIEKAFRSKLPSVQKCNTSLDEPFIRQLPATLVYTKDLQFRLADHSLSSATTVDSEHFADFVENVLTMTPNLQSCRCGWKNFLRLEWCLLHLNSSFLLCHYCFSTQDYYHVRSAKHRSRVVYASQVWSYTDRFISDGLIKAGYAISLKVSHYPSVIVWTSWRNSHGSKIFPTNFLSSRKRREESISSNCWISLEGFCNSTSLGLYNFDGNKDVALRPFNLSRTIRRL